MRTKWLLGIAIIISISLQVEYPTAHATSSIVGSDINTCGSGLSSCAVTVPSGGTSYMYTTLTSPNMRAVGLFGLSVAASGSIVVVGAQGAAYTFNSKTGSLTSTLTSHNAEFSGDFGFSVAASGDIVVVGSPGETAKGQVGAGHVYTFNQRTGGLISTLTSPNAQLFGHFGSSVAASGDQVVVGAPDETTNGQLRAGHAYTFSANTGDLISTLRSPNTQSSGLFGVSVAASGDIVVVGASFETVNGQVQAGHAYAFNAKTGGLISTLTSPNPNADDLRGFGLAVAASGDQVVVGAQGAAYTFNAKTGSLINTLTNPNSRSGGLLVVSVAARSDVVVVGAGGDAYTFNANTGGLISTLGSPNTQSGGGFGHSVAASGNIVVVGSPYEMINGEIYAGHAYIVPVGLLLGDK